MDPKAAWHGHCSKAGSGLLCLLQHCPGGLASLMQALGLRTLVSAQGCSLWASLMPGLPGEGCLFSTTAGTVVGASTSVSPLQPTQPWLPVAWGDPWGSAHSPSTG